ncbi:MAG: PAS domain S-box protein [Acidobacteria bacterium]|nr:PAS domain S-box protein [Acidobacteriota bacterium]
MTSNTLPKKPVLKEDTVHRGSAVSAKGASSRILGRGEMAERIRELDWAATPLGAVESWPTEQVTIVNLMLASPVAARSLWGPEFILLYNDAYIPVLGPRHPATLGRPAREIDPASWQTVQPIIAKIFATGEPIYREKLPVPMPAGDGLQLRYLNYWLNPIYADGRIIGLFAPIEDVTEEVIATRNLRESEARASRILESIGDAVIVTDAEACITRMNAVAEGLTGWTLEEAEGRPLAEVFRIVNEDTREAMESPAEKVRRLGTVVGLANHTILIAKDGSETHIDDSGAPVRDDAGELTGIVLVFRNIDERREAERHREALTEQLKQVQESTTDAILSIDRSWRITYVNRTAQTVLEPMEELVGRDFWTVFPSAAHEGSLFFDHCSRAMNEGVAGEFETEYASPLNIWVRVHVRPSRDGIVLFFRDVTEEKASTLLLQHTMDALRASEEELRWTIDLSPQVTWTADTDGNITDLSERWLELTGIARDDAMGEGWMERPHPEDLGTVMEAWTRSVRSGEPYYVEHRIRTADGSYRWMRASAFPRRDSSGRIVKWYGTTEDIEERKRAEQALIQSEKLAAVGRLASSIAHEINNPLEAVTNLIYLAQTQVTDAEAKQLLETADQEIRRISVIANQTLRFHKQPSNPQGVNCGELFDAVLGMYEGKLKNAGVTVERRFRARLQVTCFEGDIRQVLSNLVANAIDAMRGGGRLLLRTREGTDWRTGREGVVITVADNGCGMSGEVVRHVFDPFYTTKGLAGTGIGLWVSCEIAQRHRGVLRVRSSEDKAHCGAVFTLFLPG